MNVRTKSLCLVVVTLYLGVAVADEAPIAENGNSGDSINRSMIVITDDDFLETSQPIWCQDSLQASIEACREQRRSTTLNLEAVRAGSPTMLRGGRPIASGPRRAICFICDDQRRVLSCWVGVPNSQQLLRFSEDADEVSLTITLGTAAALDSDGKRDANVASSLVKLVRERAANRVTRHYRPLIEKIDPSQSIEANSNLLAVALINDIKERFLVDSPAESDRWISAQQHAEARKYWCEAMFINFVGKNVDEVWPQLASNVWGAMPWRRTESVYQFATDCIETLQQRGVVLELNVAKPYLHSESIIGPVALNTDAARERESQRDAGLSKSLQAVGVKTCDLPDLAVLFHELNRPPITLRNPKTRTAHWVIFTSAESEPVMLPENAEKRLMDLVSSLAP